MTNEKRYGIIEKEYPDTDVFIRLSAFLRQFGNYFHRVRIMKQLTFLEQMNTDGFAPKTCAFTGHRELDGDFSKSDLKKSILACMEMGVTTFFSGMAMGFDMLAAELVIELKKKFPSVKLVACVPCHEQEKYYSDKDKQRYVKLLKNADEVVVLSDHYFQGCMQKRDRYMADRADLLIAYCRKTTGGTAYTVNYFKKAKSEERILYV